MFVVPYLLRKVPEDYQKSHYHSDEVHVRELLTAAGLTLKKGGTPLAAAAVRGLILTLFHQRRIGALYPQVLETLVMRRLSGTVSLKPSVSAAFLSGTS